jgi:hypothetical protein
LCQPGVDSRQSEVWNLFTIDYPLATDRVTAEDLEAEGGGPTGHERLKPLGIEAMIGELLVPVGEPLKPGKWSAVGLSRDTPSRRFW